MSPVNEPILTADDLSAQFRACGLAAGQTVLLHSSMSKLGWVVGGERDVITALLRVLTPTGTLLMPTHTADNTDPSHWQNPPVPESWWPTIRAHRPAYDPALSPTWKMGRIPELFRRWPGVLRSAHPIGSFAALGIYAEYLTAAHHLEQHLFGNDSPIGKLYALDGHILLLGVDHENDTSLHLAEARAHWSSKHTVPEGTAMLVDGRREWVTLDMPSLDTDDFNAIGATYEALIGYHPAQVGAATVRFLRMRPLVDFAVAWMETHRV